MNASYLDFLLADDLQAQNDALVDQLLAPCLGILCCEPCLVCSLASFLSALLCRIMAAWWYCATEAVQVLSLWGLCGVHALLQGVCCGHGLLLGGC